MVRTVSTRAGAWVLLWFVVALTACSTVPYSERSRVILLPAATENKMGEDAYREILAKEKLATNPQQVAMVRRVGKRIAEVVERDHKVGYTWEVNLIDKPEALNAFCLPGGKIAFYTGILDVCKSEDGVAVVMGHEVAHALARHGGERVSQSVVINLGVSVLAAASSSDPGTQQLVHAALGAGAAVGLALPFSRKHESEADYIGLMLMAKAGYDPTEAPKFWERMTEKSKGSGGPEFLSTHPSHEKRIEELHAHLSEAAQLYTDATGKPLNVPDVITAD